jgi:antitoxin FitA
MRFCHGFGRRRLECATGHPDRGAVAPVRPRRCRIRRQFGRGSDIIVLISEVIVLEQILIRNLPPGTKAALRARAKQRHRSVEAEAREVLTRALEGEPVTLVDLLSTDEGADIEFEPERLGLTARSAQL